MLAQTVGLLEILVVVLYLLLIGYLGWLGFRRTRGATDFLVAGRKTHPFVMAMSYGATFISTSAIVGFGGVAGLFGMSLLWLTFLNIFVGIFAAFVFLGGPTRRMGHRLDAHTFPELLGRRYGSRFIQVFAGLIIFLFIPLYATAVLIGGCEFIATKFGVDYTVALLVFSVLIAGYVVMGGLKGVMYTDALQGTIMFLGMLILLGYTYYLLGGVGEAHRQLGQMSGEAFFGFKAMGHEGWTDMPPFAWGEQSGQLWWIVISTITLGVGIGVLAQPQLAVRFMTVRSKRELNRAVLVGGVFILVMTGVAFTVGSLSNLYFFGHERIEGRIVSRTDDKVIAKKERDLVKRIPVELLHIDTDGDREADVHVVGQGYDLTPPGGETVAFSELMPRAEIEPLGDGRVAVSPRASSFTRAVVKTADGWEFNADSIIPTYITRAMPGWFGLIFLLTLLAAAMSTLSSQFHALGASIGRDVYQQLSRRRRSGVTVTRVGVIIGILIAVLLGHYARGGYIVARATAIFFGLCGAAFLPALIGGLFWRRATRPAAIASMASGFAITAFWLVFIKDKEARALGICQALTGEHSLLGDHPTWPVVDPLIVALPLSALVFVVVTLLTRPPAEQLLAKCFKRSEPSADKQPRSTPAVGAGSDAGDSSVSAGPH
ncbi:MAG: sodium:solute symporter family protein [Planctomycetota bacterium]